MAVSRSCLVIVLPCLLLGSSGLLGCDHLPWEKKRHSEVEAARAAEKAEADRRAAQEKAEARAQEEERKKQEQLAQAEREKAAAAVADCCGALAKAGFEERSMELMAASEVCTAAQKVEKELSEFRPEVTEKLGDKPLPPACAP